ncbi:MAG: lysophospholipid acyltransferase family protein, partial [Nitrospinae bacterium]|nr:lysophospholipid acyltransferase family protein [Nitrospinota bacterium]
ALKKNQMVGLMNDRHVRPSEKSVMVNFFNKKIRTNPLIARYHQKTQCPIIFGCCYRDGNGVPSLRLKEEVITEEGKDSLQVNTQKLYSVIEKRIKQNPEMWQWFHEYTYW